MAEVLSGPAVLKSYRHGTHRTTSPESTLARVAPIAQQVGITRVGNVTGLDCIGIPVTVAVRPNSRSFSVSQGKGLQLSAALASATMEAIELFHGEHLREQATVLSYRTLSATSRAVSPASLCGTGLPLPEQAEIAWLEGYDLLNSEACWVPWEVVHTDYTLPTDHSGENFLSGTNGLASGNHLSEAISSAICELVERDAVAIWHARDIQARSRCRLDVAAVTDEDCRNLLAMYDKAGITPRLWNVTSDIGMPAFICDIAAPTEDPSAALRRFRGAGCHPNRSIALARAMTEAAQTRLTYIAAGSGTIFTTTRNRDRTRSARRCSMQCRRPPRRSPSRIFRTMTRMTCSLMFGGNWSACARPASRRLLQSILRGRSSASPLSG